MKDINRLKGYRLKYKKYYNIDFSNNYEIHHIDLNHNNNDIENLLLLPKKLHRKYHYYINCLYPFKENNILKLNLSINSSFLLYNKDDVLIELFDVINECQEWVRYKQQLDFEKNFKE